MTQPIAKLYVVPTPLDFGSAFQTPLHQVLPLANLQIIATLTHWLCENSKSLRAFLKRVDAIVPLCHPIQHLNIQQLPAQSESVNVTQSCDLLAPILAGHSMGLASEAGMPAIADPGATMVQLAHSQSIQVVPLVGPCSIILALSASGLYGQHFAFLGYLPKNSVDLHQKLEHLIQAIQRTGQSQIFIETPYRNVKLCTELLQIRHPEVYLSISQGLTLEAQRIQTRTLADWRRHNADLPNRSTPCIYILGKP
ncbi:MAG: SAM-dependent methyltransferase [Gammaproteobacteria bacterium]|nr:SAM-dependent methyltransferase [Gammaproteobacteria bacterium]